MSVSQNRENNSSSNCCNCPLYRDDICSTVCNGKVLLRDIVGHLEDGGYSSKLIMKFLIKTFESTLNDDETRRSTLNRVDHTTETSNLDNSAIFSGSTTLAEHDDPSIFTQQLMTGDTNRPPVETTPSSNIPYITEDETSLISRKVSLTRKHSDLDRLNLNATSSSSSSSSHHTKSSSSSNSSETIHSRKSPRIAPNSSPGIGTNSKPSIVVSSNNSSSFVAATNTTSPALSSLETARLANIARNNQFMASLGFDKNEDRNVVEKKPKKFIVSVGEGFQGYDYSYLKTNFKEDKGFNYILYKARLDGLLLHTVNTDHIKLLQHPARWPKITEEVNQLMGLRGKFLFQSHAMINMVNNFKYYTLVELTGLDLIEFPAPTDGDDYFTDIATSSQKEGQQSLGLSEGRAKREIKPVDITYKLDPMIVKHRERRIKQCK